MTKTKDQEMRERFWRIWKNFDDFGNHDTDPNDLLELFDKEIAKAREEMKKKVRGLEITFSKLNGCSCPSCIKELGTEHYNQAIYDVINIFKDNPFV